MIVEKISSEHEFESRKVEQQIDQMVSPMAWKMLEMEQQRAEFTD